MHINSLMLNNFGLYAGRQTIDVSTVSKKQKTKSIVLIGGKNGAGKTSFLEAIRLALYGKLALGERSSQSSYEAYLRSRVHTGPSQLQATEASVELVFEYAESGTISTYKVSRSWVTSSESVSETLDISKDGGSDLDIPRDEWQSFLYDLLPIGVSQLFFFDGEKITEIAEDTSNGQHLSTAVRSLLGIDLIGRLRTDLGLYIARNAKAENGRAGVLDKLVQDANTLRDQRKEYIERQADLLTTLASQQRVVNSAQQRFTSVGGEVALNRTELETERTRLKSELNTLISEFRDGSARAWPWLLAPKLLSTMKSAIQDKETGHGNAGQKLLKEFESWLEKSDSAVKERWSPSHQFELKELVQSTLQVGATKTRAAAFVQANAADLIRRVGEQRAPARVFSEKARMVELRLIHIDKELNRIDEGTTSYYLDELLSAQQTYGETNGHLKTTLEDIKNIDYKISLLERERERFLEEQTKEEKQDRKLALASQVSSVMASYEKALISQKINALELAFVECFSRLARKSDLVRSVSIDAETFQATLLDQNKEVIPRSILSAGEKQVFAIAMLWALAKSSGRSLPIIIDTPLARLDSEHRSAILQRYFTEVSHQVVVLSTDTEIDDVAAQDLSPFIARKLTLEYIPGERRTAVVNGYFKKSDQQESTNAL